MPRLTHLLALTRLTWLPWAALPREEEETDPLAGPPIELVTEDGVYLITEDGNFIGVPFNG